jgi:hypothetical protein
LAVYDLGFLNPALEVWADLLVVLITALGG